MSKATVKHMPNSEPIASRSGHFIPEDNLPRPDLVTSQVAPRTPNGFPITIATITPAVIAEVAKLSPRLSKLKNKEGVITNIQIGSSLRNTFWGSKKWLNIDNSVKSEHMYKEDYLLDKINPKREL